MNYWDYYNEKFGWPNGIVKPDIEKTLSIYRELGISDNDSEDLIQSGYVCIHGETIIDRYYGGAVLSSDCISRIHKNYFKEWYMAALNGNHHFRKKIPFYAVNSLSELELKINQIKDGTRRNILFRGQTQNHTTVRKIKNPNFLVDELGEVSFVPSLWRNMLTTASNSYHNFEGMSLLEWSKIIYSQFNLKDIDKRIQEQFSNGNTILNVQDMEDSSDPILSSFGRMRLDLQMGIDFNLADILNTLLQHYGLVSPYLDLTSDIKTALFFSSNKFHTKDGKSKYEYIGNNDSKSIIYVFMEDRNEMSKYEHDRVLGSIDPQRPKLQSCYICRSSPFAINLAGLFLVAAIKMNFEIPAPNRLVTSDLFPDANSDKLLNAFLCNTFQPNIITSF